MTTVYMMKWLFQSGIMVGTTEDDPEETHIRARVHSKTGFFTDSFQRGDWRTTPKAAIARAEAMRRDRVASLHASIAKLEALTFTIPEDKP